MFNVLIKLWILQKQGEVLDLLKSLQEEDMNLDILSSTRIGMTVNKIRKATEDKEVISLAKNLIRKWKKFLPGSIPINLTLHYG